jgi:hypothetical protein
MLLVEVEEVDGEAEEEEKNDESFLAATAGTNEESMGLTMSE